MSIADWINAYVPGGITSNLGQLLDIAYNIEYGAETSQQSSLNMLYLLGYAGPGNLRIFGKSNEKYHVRGGNDQVPALLTQALGAQITLGSELVAITPQRRRHVPAHVQAGRLLEAGDGRPRRARAAVLDHALVGRLVPGRLRPGEVAARSASRAWERTPSCTCSSPTATGTALGNNGNTYADTGYQNTWEVTRSQPGRSGILVDYTGGTIGASFGTGTPASRAQQFLRQLEPVLPGISAKFNGRATVDFWTGVPVDEGLLQLLEGRASTRRSPAPRASARATATSPASTPRSTSRATSTAPWTRASALPTRSSPT